MDNAHNHALSNLSLNILNTLGTLCMNIELPPIQKTLTYGNHVTVVGPLDTPCTT